MQRFLEEVSWRGFFERFLGEGIWRGFLERFLGEGTLVRSKMADSNTCDASVVAIKGIMTLGRQEENRNVQVKGRKKAREWNKKCVSTVLVRLEYVQCRLT